MHSMYLSIEDAKAAHAAGAPEVADAHLRRALSIANTLKRRDFAAGVFRCRNKLRPQMRGVA